MSDDTENQTGTPPEKEPGVSPVTIEEEMKRSYLDYAMSVIVSRAIPDVRDGLKPVHRRILYSMHENGFTREKAYKKSARVVGDVIGKYHPHGDSAVYDALVRMAQDFSMRLPLLDGQGNFGSVDGDPPAAMRYTEVRMDHPAAQLLADIEKNTVNFQDNYDSSESEPVVLPARFPNILVNGAGGIAVGMATNIAPHNLGEVIDATIALLDGELTDEELLEIIPGPDFPTGGLIMGRSGAKQGVLTGRGSVTVRAVAEVEEIRKDRYAIVVTEIPFQVNKASMIGKIAALVNEKRIEGISAVRDESDRDGMRVVVELKRDAVAEVVLNQLYRYTPLQQNFSSNMLALNGGKPEQMNVRQMIEAFLSFREDVIARRTKFDLSKARDRAHILVGLATAVANIDEIIRLIRTSANPAAAREALTSRSWSAETMGALIRLIADPRSRLQDDGTIKLTDEQARAILDLRLQKLTALGMEEITEEAEKLAALITDLLAILRSRDRVRTLIRDELTEVREKFATPRRSAFMDGGFDFDDEDLIAVEDMVVTVTNGGYVKRTPLDTYRSQHRGGKGRSGMQTKDEDFVTTVFVATTHTPILLFSSSGMAYKLKVWKVPQGGAATRGRSFNQLLPLDGDEKITSIMALPENEEDWAGLDIMFASKSGGVRRNSLADFTRINRNGKIAMKPDEGDGIVDVRLCSEQDDIVLTTLLGRAIRFPVTDARRFVGRTSSGVRGIKLGLGDEVISMAVLRHFDATSEDRTAYLKHANAMRKALGDDVDDSSDDEDEVENETALSDERLGEMGAAEQFLLTIADDGLGKRASSYSYPVRGRGGKGVIAQNLDRGKKADDAELVRSFVVEDGDQIMLVTDGGQLLRTGVDNISIVSRSSKGVWVIRTREDEHVVSVERIAETEDEEVVSDGSDEGEAPEGDTDA
ncbi:DNA gyrase subunit A [Algimonas ampicilliniresistens]|uniref:DNA gyrase subunit A n=1 Tax=Algimonas ampicilliniresistens TaxID=1298735 RepID=A0ABQ5V6P2_9PROT|nr:DNA gyrase subunit A [Algimonas ampicilliniresistens]GLQ23128.1 DNA gyrase subunit A [Algimonas ampicilliniresistens]